MLGILSFISSVEWSLPGISRPASFLAFKKSLSLGLAVGGGAAVLTAGASVILAGCPYRAGPAAGGSVGWRSGVSGGGAPGVNSGL